MGTGAGWLRWAKRCCGRGARPLPLRAQALLPNAITARILTSQKMEGEKSRAPEVLTPAAVFLNGSPIEDLQEPVMLHEGGNPLLVCYNHAGRGCFVLRGHDAPPPPTQHTPLAMSWFDDPAVFLDPIRLECGPGFTPTGVRVNGEVAGVRVAPPWRVDISRQMKLGDNRIEVLVFDTLANHYLTIPTCCRGEPTSGLLEPVVLEPATPN